MNTTPYLLTSTIILSTSLLFGCASTADKPAQLHGSAKTTFGNSNNIKVIKNRTMMFHDIVVTKTTDGAELEGKIHVKGHQDYVPGHIDIAVIDNQTGDSELVVTTDFNSRIARHGRFNLRHPNNIGTRLPGVDPDKSTVVIGYHYSNVGRFSKIDCGANVALAATDKNNR